MTQEDKLALLEALLFVWGDPITETELCRFLDITATELDELLHLWQRQLAKPNRGLTLKRFGHSAQLTTKSDMADQLKQLITPPKQKNFSQAMLETLLIIALHQPTLKTEVERIRGVRSDAIIAKLLELEMIEVYDRLDTIGRPMRYQTTDHFLQSFGFRSLEEFSAQFNLEVAKKHNGENTHEN